MDAKGLGDRIDTFEDTFRALTEAGLFAAERRGEGNLPNQGLRSRALARLLKRVHALPAPPVAAPAATPSPQAKSSEAIAESIRKARDLVEEKHLSRAAEELTRGEVNLHKEVYRRSRAWRCVRVHQVPIFLFYLGSLVVLAALALSPVHRWFPRLWGVPSAVLALGVLGALLRGLYWLQLQVSGRIFRTQFVIAHFAAPWIGLLLAVGSYLLVNGGLLTLEASGGHSANSMDHDFLIRVVAFLAGFNWTWFLTRLNQLFASGSSSIADTSKK